MTSTATAALSQVFIYSYIFQHLTFFFVWVFLLLYGWFFCFFFLNKEIPLCVVPANGSNDGLLNCILLACLDNFLPANFIPHMSDLGFLAFLQEFGSFSTSFLIYRLSLVCLSLTCDTIVKVEKHVMMFHPPPL